MSWQILQGDVRQVLETLPDASVQCCVTSPPYWGLRDYGTATWDGGDAACDHRSPTMREGRNENRATLGGGVMATNSAQLLLAARTNCGKCGAVRIDNQIGLEATPDAYVAQMVQVFAQVRRVLKDDGTLWLNLGDSYATQGGRGEARMVELGRPSDGAKTVASARGDASGTKVPDGLKAKDLCGIPWRVAFALQADGWWLRSDIIWSKCNPMPESVTDRPTKAHEYIFLLTKSSRYFYDAAAIAEATEGRELFGNSRKLTHDDRNDCNRRDMTENWTRNCRSVWDIATQPYPEAHFATFPEAIPERCIKAGSKVGDTVLDPFCGAGTTGLVADRLERDFIGIELNPVYRELARKRIGEVTPLFPNEAAV